jgi:prevent-host-death family protein
MVDYRVTMSLSLKVLKERAVGIRDFQANPTRVLERVIGSREPLLVTRHNLPIAALIDVEELERLLEIEARLEQLEKEGFPTAPGSSQK